MHTKNQQQMKFLFEEKVITQGYLTHIQCDLEWRIDVSKGTFKSDETLGDRMKIINHHIRLLKLADEFIEQLWEQNTKLRKDAENRPTTGDI